MKNPTKNKDTEKAQAPKKGSGKIKRGLIRIWHFLIVRVVVYVLGISTLVWGLLVLIFNVFLPCKGNVDMVVTEGEITFQNASFSLSSPSATSDTIPDVIRLKIDNVDKLFIPISRNPQPIDNGETIRIQKEISDEPLYLIIYPNDMISISSSDCSFVVNTDGLFQLQSQPESLISIESKKKFRVELENAREQAFDTEMIQFTLLTKGKETTVAAIEFEDNMNLAIDPSNGSEINVSGDGTVSVYATATTQAFPFGGSKVDLKLTGSIRSVWKPGKYEVSGFAEKAEIMGHSVFPGIDSWLYDNSFSIPSLILTVFTGAISLAKASEEKRKDTQDAGEGDEKG